MNTDENDIFEQNQAAQASVETPGTSEVSDETSNAPADFIEVVNAPESFAENKERENSHYEFMQAVPAEPVQKSSKKKHPFLRRFAICVSSAACFGLVAGGVFYGVSYGYQKLFPEQPAVPPEIILSDGVKNNGDVQISSTKVSPVQNMDASDTVSRVVAQTMPAMVSVKTLYSTTTYFFGQPYYEESEGGGSGIIIGSNDTDLLIATNYHVIDQAKDIKIVLADETEHSATVKGSDAAADLAILALPLSDITEETKSKIDIAVLGDSDSSKIGQMVIAIGNALGYGPSVTVGYLSAKDREISISGNDMVLLQTNAAINAGNSGGALLNTKGEVIGINNAKLSSTDIEGICFAIPISKATPILDELMNREILADDEKGYLGVSVKDLGSDTFEMFGWPEGVRVAAVSEGGAAEKAGIYAGDIITHINDNKVVTANQLINAVTSNRYGTEITVTIQRQNRGVFEEKKFTVTLQKLSESTAEKQSDKNKDDITPPPENK